MFTSQQSRKAKGEYNCSSTLSLISAIEGADDQSQTSADIFS